MMSRHLVTALTLLALNFSTLASSLTQTVAPIETTASQAILIDAMTGEVLFEKNPDQLTVPSSMTKIMTVYLLFSQIKSGEVKLSDTFSVSTAAWRKQGSKMFVNLNENVNVEDLIRGIVVQSGNDASIVVAEGLSGAEDVFAAEMTKVARELGAKNTTFKNATGWPDPLHLSTARDLATISLRLIKDFPEMYKRYFSETDFTYNKIHQMNRNPLLYKTNLGADGIKTGHTDDGGYGLVASAVQDGRRLVLVVNGLPSIGERARQAEALLLWGFRNFKTPLVFRKNQPVVNANVWLGAKPTVPLVVKNDIYYTVERSKFKDLKVEAKYTDPIAAPLAPGQVVGKIIVSCGEGKKIIESPLYTTEAVEQAGFADRIKAAFNHLMWGHSDGKK